MNWKNFTHYQLKSIDTYSYQTVFGKFRVKTQKSIGILYVIRTKLLFKFMIKKSAFVVLPKSMIFSKRLPVRRFLASFGKQPFARYRGTYYIRSIYRR